MQEQHCWFLYHFVRAKGEAENWHATCFCIVSRKALSAGPRCFMASSALAFGGQRVILIALRKLSYCSRFGCTDAFAAISDAALFMSDLWLASSVVSHFSVMGEKSA